jgi:hypothetical protein
MDEFPLALPRPRGLFGPLLEPGRWLRDRVPVPAFRSKCVDAGLSAADTEKLVDFLRKAQSGRRLRPGSRFAHGYKYVWPYE